MVGAGPHEIPADPRAGNLGAVVDAPRRRPVPPRWRAAVRLVAGLASVLALGACRADLSVELDADARGAGHVRATVTLDRAAADRVPDLAEQLRVEDLEQAGWVVDEPAPVPGGGVTLRASRRFTSPAGAARAVEELSGPGGPFSLQITTEHGLWTTRTALRGTVDLRAGLGAFGDAGLAEVLGGPGLGLDPAELERELGRPLSEAVGVEVVGRLPGSVTANAPASRGTDAVWPVPLGATAEISASSEVWNRPRVAFAALAAVCGLLLALVLVRRRRR